MRPGSIPNGSTTWTFTYNADGIRTQKTDGSTVYKYTYNGSTLTQLDVGTNRLFFVYDGTSPTAVVFNNTTYYYVTNLQGDIIAILNGSGTKVVEYAYDAWGKLLSTTGSMASTLGVLNPLRYRGYVYDTETGLYYVSSRYYNPEIGRWINADDIDLLGANSDFTSLNLFAYCGNNPVSRSDESGHFWAEVIAAAAVIAVTIHDIYQLSKEDNITASYTEGQKSVQITNSYKIISPWVQYGYSLYLNHFSEYKDYFVGSTIGMTFEWTLHNFGVAGFTVAAVALDTVRLDSEKMVDKAKRCKDVDIGPTIYHDDPKDHGAFSYIMKGGYYLTHVYAAIYDGVQYWLN